MHGPHNHLIPLYLMFTKVDELSKISDLLYGLYMKPLTYRNSRIMSPLSAYNFSFFLLYTTTTTTTIFGSFANPIFSKTY